MKQTCPLCQRRRARRSCPALGQWICAVCCGKKRLVEIRCPADCSYLVSAQAHPPAVVQRQQECDLRFLLPLLHGLTERQKQILLLLQGYLCTERPDVPTMTDADVEQAAKAMAETYETASRGILFEHMAASLSAQHLGRELKILIEAKRGEGARIPDADVSVVMRRIETAARGARQALGGGETAYLSMLKRVMQAPGEPSPAQPADRQPSTGRSSLILPGQ